MHLLSIYEKTREFVDIVETDALQLNRLEIKMKNNYCKMFNRIIDIIHRKQLINYVGTKKYMIKNKFMFEALARYIKENNLNVTFKHVVNTNTFVKRIENIYETELCSDKYCEHCDEKRIHHNFTYKNVPNEYIEITYCNNNSN